MHSNENNQPSKSSTTKTSRIDWDQLNAEILSRLGLRKEAEVLGVRFSASQPNDSGWLACHAIDREDANPSAAFCAESTNGSLGRYKDHGGEGTSLSFWDLSVRLGKFPDWKAARKHYADKVGVELPTCTATRRSVSDATTSFQEVIESQLSPLSTRKNVELQKVCSTQFANAKSLNAEKVMAADAFFSMWPVKACPPMHVLGFSAYDPQDWTKPVAILLYRVTGEVFPAVTVDGKVSLKKRKTHLLRGSKDGLICVGGIEALEAAGTVWLCEGLTDAIKLAEYLPEGEVSVTNTSGATAFARPLAKAFADKVVYIVMDADRPGCMGAGKRAKLIIPVAKEVRIVKLPYEVTENHGKDLRDFFSEGNDFCALSGLATDAPTQTAVSGNDKVLLEKPKSESISNNANSSAGESKVKQSKLPYVTLPGHTQTTTDCATELGTLLAKKKTHFNRGGNVCCIVEDPITKNSQLKNVNSKQLASDFEKVAKLLKYKTDKDGQLFVEASICSAMDAGLIINAQDFLAALPAIDLVSPCPVLTEVDEKLVEITGYHEESRVFAHGSPVEQIEIEDSKQLLSLAIDGFRFASKSDRSRALATLITPALIMGQLLPGRATIDLTEADQSQSGKGYRNKCTSAIYKQVIRTVADKSGIGSLDEAFDAVLISGATFVSLDNIRGRVDSQSIESFMTEDTYTARASYSRNTLIDPKRITVMFTSNKADISRDLANRCCCTRIMKQPPGHHFAKFSEGDLLDHIKANQPLFLGAVFAVVKAWYEAGKPRTDETRHDFRGWAQALDWIVQNILHEAPLLDDHQDTQERMVNPHLNWLRDVAIAVVRDRKQDEWLMAHHLIDILDGANVDIPGLPEEGDLGEEATHRKVLTATGKRMGRCFTEAEVVTIGDMTIERCKFKDEYSRPRLQYRVTATSDSIPMERSAHSSDRVALQRNENVCKEDNGFLPFSASKKPAVPATSRDTPAKCPAIKPESPATPARESITV